MLTDHIPQPAPGVTVHPILAARKLLYLPVMDGSSPDISPPAGLVSQVVSDGIRRYFAERHRRVAGFTDRHFSVRGTARIYRAALGLDVLRAPANLFLAAPHTAMKAGGAAASRLGASRWGRRLGSRSLLLRTEVSRRLEWLLCTELLELPIRQGKRESRRDALAETILEDPRLALYAEQALEAVGRRTDDPEFRAKLAETMTGYAGTRAAAAEIATSLLTVSSGALAVKQLTPGAVTLGPALAAAIAQQSAIAGFPLGAGLGSVWYGMFPVAPPAMLVVGLTGGLMLGASFVAAFAGLLTDPLQRRLGLHARRLHRMLDALERQMLDPSAPGYVVHDHYAARVMDLLDLLGSAYRLAHG